jgi:hypothetical protein
LPTKLAGVATHSQSPEALARLQGCQWLDDGKMGDVRMAGYDIEPEGLIEQMRYQSAGSLPLHRGSIPMLH